MKEYKSYARCGFCKHYGATFTDFDEDVCAECEVRLIRQYLEDILDKFKFDHNHKYRKDDEDHVRNCAHCEYGRTYETRYEVDAAFNGEVWCELNCDPNTGPSTNKGSDCCEKWRRAKDQR